MIARSSFELVKGDRELRLLPIEEVFKDCGKRQFIEKCEKILVGLNLDPTRIRAAVLSTVGQCSPSATEPQEMNSARNGRLNGAKVAASDAFNKLAVAVNNVARCCDHGMPRDDVPSKAATALWLMIVAVRLHYLSLGNDVAFNDCGNLILAQFERDIEEAVEQQKGRPDYGVQVDG